MLLQGITTSLGHRRASAWAVRCPGHRDAWESPKPLSTILFPALPAPGAPTRPPARSLNSARLHQPGRAVVLQHF